jgi:hypothetical protein
VLYIDFEDDEAGVAGRLLTLGAKRALIAERFHYLRPHSALNAVTDTEDFGEVLRTYRPTLSVIDGITEAMAMFSLNPLDNLDVAKFGILTRGIAGESTAVVSLDHVKKDRESRGRYALGAVHKLNALDGAGYILENRHPFGIGIRGVSTVKIAKDRPAQLRVNALPSNGGLHWYGDLVLASRDEDFAEVSIEPPHERAEDFRPTVMMAKIATILSEHGPRSKRALRLLVPGKHETKDLALEYLIIDGYVTEKTPHALIKPYELKV